MFRFHPITWKTKILTKIQQVEEKFLQEDKVISLHCLPVGVWVSNYPAWSTSQVFSSGATSLLGLQLMGKWNTLPFACIHTCVFEYAIFSNMFVRFIHGVFYVWAMPPTCFVTWLCLLSKGSCHFSRNCVFWGYVFLLFLLGLHLVGKWNTMTYACIHIRVLEYANF